MKKLLFILNLKSGRGQIKNDLPEILDMAVKAGFDVTVRTTQGRGDATSVVEKRAKEFDRIICSGGDGTLDEVVTGLMRVKVNVPIGYIPAGSTNDFGSSLGIDNSILSAADTVINGESIRVDVGSFNDNSFIYLAAFGVFTEASYSTNQDLKNVFGHVAYLFEGIKSLRNIPSYMMKVKYDGNVLYDEFVFGMITNSKSVGGFKNILPDDVELNDGLFEVALIKPPKNPIELSEIISTLRNYDRESDLIYSFTTSNIEFISGEEIAWTLDGEFGGRTKKAKIINQHNAIEILVESQDKNNYNN